jgi:hypothetical protein
MSLDYTTLQSTVLAQAKRSDLTTEVVQFIRSCESMIRRKVMGLEFRAALDETDRVSEGFYALPSYVQEVRAVFGLVNGNRIELQNVGVHGINGLSPTDAALFYAVSAGTIEFRGVPGTDSEFELVCFGWPDPLATTASNDLLTLHEDLYVFGTLFFLYNHTQDLELAQASLSVFEDCVKHINKSAQRVIGNPTAPPMYNFGQVPTGSRY